MRLLVLCLTYAREQDVIHLNWLPHERVTMAVLKLAYEGLLDEHFPGHSKLKKKDYKRSAKSLQGHMLNTEVWKKDSNLTLETLLTPFQEISEKSNTQFKSQCNLYYRDKAFANTLKSYFEFHI